MSIQDLSEVRAHVEILQYVEKQKAKLKELEGQARTIVEQKMGGHDTGILDGEVVITWSHYKENRIDSKALREAHPELAASYTNANARRRFEVK